MMDEIAESLAARRAELEAERDSAFAALPAARLAYTAAFRGLEDAQHRWNPVVVLVDRGVGETGTLSVALADVLQAERAKYDASGAALRRAKDHVANLQWVVEARNLDLEQLDRLAHPPKPAVATYEVVKRPQPQSVDVDTIVFPAASRAA